MARKSLLQTVMEKEEVSQEQAQEWIDDARNELMELVAQGEHEEAQNICETHFGLEPDYLEDLLPM